MRRANGPNSTEEPLSFSERLREIDRFFQGKSAVHRTTRRLARILEEANIPYAVVGGMAVNAHGHAQTTDDVDVLLTPSGNLELLRHCVGEFGPPPMPRRGRLVDKRNNVPVDIVLTGERPSRYGANPIKYPDPEAVAEVVRGIRYVNLLWLVQLKLATRRYRDLGDVAALIRVRDLDASYIAKLHQSLHRYFDVFVRESPRARIRSSRVTQPR
jgi:hypothetical protein